MNESTKFRAFNPRVHAIPYSNPSKNSCLDVITDILGNFPGAAQSP
jgi:hypothetical protein